MYESLFYMSEYRGKNILFDLYLRIFGYPIYVRRIEARAIFRLVGNIEGQMVLDLGCGDGFLSIPMSKRGAKVIAVDIDGEKFKLAKVRFSKMDLPIEPMLVLADAQHMPFRNGAFDAVISNCVIEHIPNDDAVFQETNRAMQATGRFVGTVPSEEGMNVVPLTALWISSPKWLRKLFASEYFVENDFRSVRQARKYLKRYLFAECHHYTKEGFHAKMTAAGFKVEEFEYLIQFFGAIVQDLVFGLRCIFLNTGTAFLFPILYPISLLDMFFLSPNVMGDEFVFLVCKRGPPNPD
jgi:ubiquinone/menaquinone biosynthesis C-methylase UbiE